MRNKVINMANALEEEQDRMTPPSAIRPYNDNHSSTTGQKIDKDKVCFEVVRMLNDGMPYHEIELMLKQVYHFSVDTVTIGFFKRNFYPYYKEPIERVDKSRHQHLVMRMVDEIRARDQSMQEEVIEIQSLIVKCDERMSLIEKQAVNPALEGVLKEYVKTKAILLERLTKITGSSGLDGRLKDVAKQVAMSAQKALVPYLRVDKKEEAYELWELELEGVIQSVEASMAAVLPGSKKSVRQ